MTLYNSKEMKLATIEGGIIGKMVRNANAGGRLVHVIGSNVFIKKVGQPINLIVEYRDCIGLLIQLSTFNHQWIVIPKKDVIEWGVLDRKSIDTNMNRDRSSTIVGLLLYGPIGALVGSSLDDARNEKQASRPLIGITYRNKDVENSIFLEFTLAKWYHNLNDFLLSCLPEQHRE